MSSLSWSTLKDFALRRRDQHPVPVMDGAFTPNDGLERCADVGPPVHSPDDVAFGPDGALYLSAGRAVLRCDGDGYRRSAEVVAFEGDAGGLALHPDGRLLVCVSGVGLAAVNPAGRTDWLKEADGVPLRCLTAVTAAPGGEIYLADGSTRNLPEKWCHDLMEKNSLGRLVRCGPDLDRAATLLGGLRYPHGAALSHDGRHLWFTESWAHTVSRYALGEGTTEQVVRNLPGYPARLSAAPEETFWLSLFAVRTHLVELTLRENRFRTEMMRTVDPDFWIAPSLAATGFYLEPLQGGAIKKLGIIKPWAPPRSYGLVARISAEGEAMETLHSRVGGRCHGITSAREARGRLIIVSKGHHRVLMQQREAQS